MPGAAVAAARGRRCAGSPCRARGGPGRRRRPAPGRAARRSRRRSPSAAAIGGRRGDELALLKLGVEERPVLLRGRVVRLGRELPLDRRDRLDPPPRLVQLVPPEPLDQLRVEPQGEVPRVEQHILPDDRVVARRLGVEEPRERVGGRVVLLGMHERDRPAGNRPAPDTPASSARRASRNRSASARCSAASARRHEQRVRPGRGRAEKSRISTRSGSLSILVSVRLLCRRRHALIGERRCSGRVPAPGGRSRSRAASRPRFM